MLGSHDMERFASAIINPDRWIDHGNNLKWNPEFEIRKPNNSERNIQKSIIAFQFAFIGAPIIYYGDEVGMWGADDPDCRKPMLWNEYIYDDESAHPCDIWDSCDFSRPVDKVEINNELLDFYKSMIILYKDFSVFRNGDYKTHYINDEDKVFAFKREYDNEKIIAIFNSSYDQIKISKKILPGCDKRWKLISGKIEKHRINPKGFAIFYKN